MELNDYVGMFIVSFDGNYGMIDAVHGKRLGFIFSDKEAWTCRLIDVDKVVILEQPEDIKKAYTSAMNYLTRERDRLIRRIDMKLKNDDQDALKDAYDYVVEWISRLSLNN